MGLFGNKKDAAVEEPEQQSAPITPSKRKKKDSIASVLHESVLENVLEELRENEAFIAKVNGESVYVTLALDAAAIGGLSKSTAKGNEAKGSIIECINSGRIKAIVTPELVEMDTLLFIPDALTMDAMDEFGLLTDVDYKLAFVHPDDGISITEYSVSFDRVKKLVDNDQNVSGLLSEFDVSENNTAADDNFDDSNDDDDDFDSDSGKDDFDDDNNDDDVDHNDFDDDFSNDFNDDENGIDDEDEDDNDIVVDDAMDEDDDAIPFEIESNDDDFDDDDDGIASDDDFVASHLDAVPVDDYQDDDQFEYDDESVDMPDDFEVDDDMTDVSDGASDDESVGDNITEERMRDVITRRFYSDELGLEVTTAPFDAQFMQDDSMVLFDENRDTSGENGWVSEFLNQMSKDANNELMRLHTQNLLAMRTQYFQLVSLHAEKIQKDLDTTDSDTQYGQLATHLLRQKSDAMGTIGNVIADRKKELTDTFEKNVQKVGEDAAHAAMQQYRERYGRIHEGQLAEVEATVKRQIDDEYQDAVRDMNAARKLEASKLLDYGITETLRVMSETYATCLQQETELYNKHRDMMQSFLDNQALDEVTRLQAENAEKQRAEMEAEVREESQRKIQQITNEYNIKTESLRSDIEHIRASNAELIRQKDIECSSRVSAVSEENQRLRAQYDNLLNRYSELDDKKSREYAEKYADQIADLRSEKKAAQEELKQATASHKRNNIIAAMFVVVGIVAALVVGWLFGTHSNVNQTLNDTQNAIVSEFNDRVNALEAETTSVPTEAPTEIQTEAVTEATAEALTEPLTEGKPAA